MMSVYWGRVMSLGVKPCSPRTRYVMIEPLLSNNGGQILASANDGCPAASYKKSRFVCGM